MLDATETIIPFVEYRGENTEQVDSGRESHRQSKHPHTNPLKQIIDKIEKKKSKKSQPNFGVTTFPIPLQWVEAVREGEVRAEILCSAEFIQVDCISSKIRILIVKVLRNSFQAKPFQLKP